MSPRFVFAHGAGAPSSSPWMKAWRRRLSTLGDVTGFDYDYMKAGRAYPDRMPALLATHRKALRRAERKTGGKLVLAGKSMGSRVGCHLSLEEDVQVDALVCFGYPLVGMGKRRPVRNQVLEELATPILFVQGTRDTLCPLPLLQKVRKKMSAPSALHVVEGGDHSLQVGKRMLAARGQTQDDVDAAILDTIARWL